MEHDLLKPRIKVIADFWDSPFEVGEVILFDTYSDYYDPYTDEVLGQDWSTPFMELKRRYKNIPEGSKVVWNMRAFIPYPHLFQELNWWEEKGIETLPRYLRYNLYEHINFAKIEEYQTNNFGELYGVTLDTPTNKLFIRNASPIPATKEEYEAYIKEQTV